MKKLLVILVFCFSAAPVFANDHGVDALNRKQRIEVAGMIAGAVAAFNYHNQAIPRAIAKPIVGAAKGVAHVFRGH